MTIKKESINNSLFIILIISGLFLLFSKNKLEDSIYLLKSRSYIDSLKLESLSAYISETKKVLDKNQS